MRKLLMFLTAVTLEAQLRPLHVTASGIVVDDSEKPVVLRGVNRSGTGSGNADASTGDGEYAAQNQLLSINLVRLFVNAAWWNSNVNVPIANQKYQDYIDTLIQRAKKYGNYVLVVKAGQFPDPPCGADGKSCPAPNQGDLNCQANASLCVAQDTSGTYIDVGLSFWSAFSKKYGSDPAVLYDTWEEMRVSDPGTWSDNQNQLIATIRDYAPQSLIFVEDGATSYESVVAGTTPDLAWPNIVWSLNLYNTSTTGCTEPASPRAANFPKAVTGLVSYAQQHGHAVAITEWGGCNDSEPYHTNIASFARVHAAGLAYFDSSNLLTQSGSTWQLTSTGTKVAQAYVALAAGGSGPAITLVANAEGEVPVIAPNTWVEIKGTNLGPANDSRLWDGTDFFNGQMPALLDGVSVTVNGKNAFVYYISPTQVNILTPPDPMLGQVKVQLTNAGVASTPVTVPAQAVAPSFFVFNGGPYVAAEHSDGTFLGPTSLYKGLTTPAKPGETIVLFANGFGPTTQPIVSGTLTQGGMLSPLPAIKIGGVNATVTFAGLIFPGEFQINVVVPASLADGDQPIVATYNGANSQPGTLLTVQH